MAEVVHEDIEQILMRLDAKDLILCKSVCKFWRSIITNPHFINRHLNHNSNEDRYNNELGHRRITLFRRSCFFNDHRLVGSSNGLVCISYALTLSIGNPLTRELRQLRLPTGIHLSSCYGFGYDSSVDDYKIVAGGWKARDQTCVQVLSLKSNVWRVIGEVKYRFMTTAGILCNGALHWIVRDQDNKKLIISYNLSKEEFKEIPQPEDARYECTYISYLGIFRECLCIFHRSQYPCVDDIWLMKKYNVKESWELLPCDRDLEMRHDIVHFLRLGLPKDEDASWFCRALEHLYWEHMVAPIYVQSLVSPHVNGKPERGTKRA